MVQTDRIGLFPEHLTSGAIQNLTKTSNTAAGPNHNVFSFLLVYRASLDKHKTLNFDSLQARFLKEAKGISLFFWRLWRANPYSFV